MKIAIIGATGMVGKEMIDALSNCKLPISNLIPVASEKSLNQKLLFNGRN